MENNNLSKDSILEIEKCSPRNLQSGQDLDMIPSSINLSTSNFNNSFTSSYRG